MDESSKPKKLTLSLIIRWIFGLLFALSFLGALMQGSILGALLMLIATIITLPPTSQAIERAMNFSLSGALRFVVVFVLFVGAGIVMPNSDTPATDTNDIPAAPSADASTGQTTVTEKKEPTEISTPIIEETPKSEEKTTKLEDASYEKNSKSQGEVVSLEDAKAEELIEDEEDSTDEEYQEELAKQKAEEASSSGEPEKEIVSTSFSDFALYSDPSATSLQKESFFDDNYKGKYVTWSGTVASVSESMGSYTVSVKHSPQSLISDATIIMRDDQKDKLLQLKEGSKITYTAKLTRYGEILGIYGEDGTIDVEPVNEAVPPTKDTPITDQTTVITSSSDEPVKEASSNEKPEKEIVSTSFSDFALYSDPSATSLQKESFFDDNYKGKYVTWSGTVSSVDESMGSYTVSVKHSSQSLISDAIITMRDDQKDKLLQLKEGSKITYTAKLTRYGEILGIYGEDGTIE